MRPIFVRPIHLSFMAKTSKPAVTKTPQPPYIKSVRLRNAPPLRDVKADFKPGLNIIIGKNGAGKTNFMKLLSKLTNLHSTQHIGADSELALVGNKKIHITFREQVTNNRVNTKFPSLNQMIQPQLLISATDGKIIVEDEYLEGAMVGLDFGSDYEVTTIYHGMPSRRLPVIDESAELSFVRGRVSVITPPTEQWYGESRLVRAFISTLILDADGSERIRPITNVNLGIVHQRVSQAMDAHLNHLNGYLSAYSPIQAVRLSTQFQLYRNDAKDAIIAKGLVLEFLVGGEWLPFSALSDGTKRIFYVLCELLSATYSIWDKEYNDFASYFPVRIILLEEPELGIHPDQLHLLLQLIREVSREHQVIMTTHSPQTLDMLTAQELDRISICEFIPGEGTKLRKLSAAKKAKAKAYLRDKGFLSEFWRFSNLEDPD